MKKILFLLFLPSILYGQAIVKGSGILYTNGVPSHSVNRNSEAEVAIDTTTGYWYERSNDGLGWLAAGFRIQKFNSSSAPTFTPADKQSEVVLNNVDSLYRYRSGAWRHLNKNRIYLGGNGITVIGNLIAAKDTSPTNELQTISTSGTSSATVTLDKSGGSFTIRGVNRTTVTHASGTITVSSNADADSLANNEGINGVGAGSGTTATIISNTPGASPITIQAGTAINISETPGSNGGTIVISNGGDLSNTNEPLTISDGTDTETLAGQTLTVVGTGSVTADYTPGTNTLTINSSGGGSVSRPATEVVVGTGSSITSSPNLVTDGTNLILGTGTTTTTGFRLELIGTGNKGDRTFAINGLPMAYLPNQTDYIGNMAFGTGLRALSHVSGPDGLYNTAVGYASGDSIGIGYGNTTLGYFAGNRLKTSFDNTFIGALAGANMGATGGYQEDDNIAIGIKAMQFADNISNSIAIGADAFQYLGSGVTTGGNSVAIGNEAGRFLYDYGTVKYYADSSLYIGHRASGGLVDNVRNENVIGSLAWGMGSNTMVLGGDRVRQTLLQGKVGVRTRTPGAWMDIRGNDASAATGTEAMLKLTRETRPALSYPQTATFSVGNSGAAHRWGSYDPMTRVDLKLNKQTSGTPTFADIVAMTWTDAGFVGIGDTMPLGLLHVGSRPGGEPTYRGDIIVNQFSPTGLNGGVEWKVDGNAAGYGYRQVAVYDGVSSYPFLFQSRHNNALWATRMTLTQGGELGINVSVPSQRLDVGGNVRVSGAYYDSSNDPGTSGQILSSTITGTNWIDAAGGGGTTNLSYTGVLSPITLNSSTGTDVDFKDSTGIRISRAAGVMTILNTGDTDPSNDLTTSTTFSGDVSGLYNDLQLGTGVVGATELAATSVTAGTYGSATQVPVITVDADGRATGVVNTTITGLLPSGTNTQTLRNSSGTWAANSILTNDGSTLTVTGTAATTPGLQITANSFNPDGLNVGTFGMSSYGLNNSWLSSNLYYNSGWKHRATGVASQLYFSAGDLVYNTAVSATAGSAATRVQHFAATANGNFNIGTATPTGKLTVDGFIAAGDVSASSGAVIIGPRYSLTDQLSYLGTEYSSGSLLMGYGQRSVSGGWNSTSGITSLPRAAWVVGANGASFHSAAAQTVSVGGSITGSAERFTITNAGNVGVGVTSPSDKLEVAGKTKTTTFQMTTGATNNYYLKSDASGNGTWTSAPWLTSAYYQTVMSNHTPVAQEAALDFVPTPRIQQTVTDNPGSNRTQVSFDIPAGGVTSTEIADATVTSTDMSATGVGAGTCTNCDLTIDAAGRVTAKANGSSGGGGTAISALTDATAINTVDIKNFTQTWNATTQVTGNVFAHNYAALTTGTAVVHTADALTTGGILQLSSNSASLNSTAGILAVKNNNTSTNGAVFSVFANSTSGTGLYVRANGRTGVGTTSPISLFNAKGIGYFGAETSPSIESTIVGGITNDDFRWSNSIENKSNTSGGHATFYSKVGGTSGGDPATIYDVPGGASWSVGIDNSATGDPLIISASQTVGTTPVLKMLSSGVSEVILDRTLTAGGTTSSQTINKLAGSVNMAAAATSLIVTNSLVNTSSLIFCQVMTNDGTMKSVQAVAGSGLFTLYPNVAPTGETKIAFMVTN